MVYSSGLIWEALKSGKGGPHDFLPFPYSVISMACFRRATARTPMKSNLLVLRMPKAQSQRIGGIELFFPVWKRFVYRNEGDHDVQFCSLFPHRRNPET